MPTAAAADAEIQRLQALNLNDKGCAFGGSLAALLTLAAWGALETALHRAGEDTDLYIADSRRG